MSEILKPETPDQIVEAIRWAMSDGTALEVAGGGSKRALGRPVQAAHRLDVGGLSGVVNYEPEELVMSALPGTSLAEIEAALEPNRQQLAFEPADLAPLLGAGAPGANTGGTIGGAIACNLAGPRRVKSGAARDHILGFQAVSGRGEAFKSGGRMFKNVTGFDFSKLMCGSYGTLAVLTELTFKVLPSPETVRTVVVAGCEADAAVRAMTAALQSACEVSAAAHLPADVAAASGVPAIAGAGAAVTALRLEGFGPSVDYRAAKLAGIVGGFGEVTEVQAEASAALWREVRDAAFFARNDSQVWRLSVPPTAGALAVETILAAHPGRAFLDWGGGLVWLALEPADDASETTVRAAISGTGGYATLIRAAESVRASVPVFEPQPGPLAELTARIKDSFDPKRVLNPGRMYAGV